MTPDEIAKLRALAGAATPWPWFVGRMPDDPRPVVMAGRGRVIVFDTAEGDTIYIAAACNAVPRLCDEIERLRGLLREAHGTLSPFAEIGRVVSEAPSSSDGPVLHVWVRRSGEAELTTLDCLRAAGLRGRIEDALKGSE